MQIWAKNLKNQTVHRVDTCKVGEVGYIVREYQMAYGPTHVVWAGKKADMPSDLVVKREWAAACYR
jgi:hypothetical protein